MDVMAEPEGAFAPEQFTGFLLRRAFVASRQCAESCIQDDVSVREIPAMTLIGDAGALSQRQLGELLTLNRTTTGKLVDALESKGWLVRARDVHDRRSYALRLTDDGRRALAGLHRSLDRGEAELTSSLSDDEQERLSAALRNLLVGDLTVTIDGLGDRCGYLIARAHQAMFHRAVAALEPLGISPRDFGILTVLTLAQPCSQQRLAEMLGVSAPAVLGFVDELEAEGLVSRRRNASDRRAYDLMVTAEGKARLDAGRQVARDLQAIVVDTLGATADKDLRNLLRKVIGPLAPSSTSPRSSSEVPAEAVDVAAS